MKGRNSGWAALAFCAVLLLAGCGGGKSIEDAEVTAVDVLIDDQSRSFDTGLPELPPVTGKDVIDVSTETVELSADDSYDTIDVCIGSCNGKECGDDGCGGSCGHCDDGDVCNGVESCEAGLCIAGKTLACDDGKPCTLDECHAQAGCQHTEHDGPCDDDNPCTEGETCLTGICTDGTKVVCDDGNPCTTDACSTVEGCIAIPNSAACSEGDPCTVGDQCVDGACEPGENICFPCQSGLDCLQYDDGNLCNGLVVCEGGLCEGLADSAVVCEQPANGCLVVECAPESGECVEGKLPGMVFCDDGNLRTLDDLCIDGTCVGKPVNCQDGDKCTDDWCDSDQGCIHEPVECPPMNCTNVHCEGLSGECIYVPMSCDDGLACTTDTCDEELDSCVHTPVSCDDGNACTEDLCIEAPIAGECVHLLSPVCDCEACSMCVCDPVDGWSCETTDCSDGDSCTLDICVPTTGTCQHSQLECADENECTADYCDSSAESAETACYYLDTAGVPCVGDVPGSTSECSGGKCLCIPQCNDTTCGDDGCGGVCGVCGDAAKCVAGSCKPVPILLTHTEFLFGGGGAVIYDFDGNDKGYALVGQYSGDGVVFHPDCSEATWGGHFFVARIAPDGTCLWVRQLLSDMEPDFNGTPHAVTLMSDGGVLVGGRSAGDCITVGGGTACADPPSSLMFEEAFLVSLDSSGAFEWGYVFGNADASGIDKVSALQSMGDGTAIVGLTYMSADLELDGAPLSNHDDECGGYYSGEDVALARINDAGAFFWTSSFGTCKSEQVRMLSLAQPDLFIVGLQASADIDMGEGVLPVWPMAFQPVFAALSNSGDHIDSNVLSSCGIFPNMWGFPSAAVGRPNGVLLGGWPSFVAKFTYGNSAPDWCWIGPGMGGGHAPAVKSLVSDAQGNTYLAGEVCVPGADAGTGILPHKGGCDILLAKLDGSGQTAWAHSLGSIMDDYPVWIELRSNGNLAVFALIHPGATIDADGQIKVNGSFILAEYEH